MKNLVVMWPAERVPAGAKDISHQYFSDLAIKAHDEACKFFERDDIGSYCVPEACKIFERSDIESYCAPMERNDFMQTMNDYRELRMQYINGADIVYFSEGWCQDPLCMADYQYCLDTNKTFLACNPLGYKDSQYKEDDFGLSTDKPAFKKNWSEFRRSGLLWFINTILHLFGWSIVIEMEFGEIVTAYPQRVNFRGFKEEDNTKGYKRLTEYMKDNATTWYNNIKEEGNK